MDACQYPRYHRGGTAPSLTPTINDWVENAGAYAFTNSWGFSWFNEIQATLTVPPPPSSPSSPLNDFLWFGFQDAAGTAVLQPVVQYGTSDAGGGNGWFVGIWYISASGAESHTSLVKVSAGNVITGTVKQSCAASGAPCSVLVTMLRNGSPVLNVALHTTDVWQLALKGVLEADGVYWCDQLPASRSTTFFKRSRVHARSEHHQPERRDFRIVVGWRSVSGYADLRIFGSAAESKHSYPLLLT